MSAFGQVGARSAAFRKCRLKVPDLGAALSSPVGPPLTALLRWRARVFVLLGLALLAGCATSSKPPKPAPPSAQLSSWSRPRFSPDGGRLAALGDGTRVFEFVLPQDLAGHEMGLPFGLGEGQVIDLNYNADGDLLVLCHATNSLSVWDATLQRIVLQRPLRVPPLGGLMSRDGQRAALYFQEPTLAKTAGLVNWNSGGNILPLTNHQASILCLAFSGDGKKLASVDGAGQARVWDGDTGTLLAKLPTEMEKGVGAAFDREGKTFALAGRFTRIQRMEVQQYQLAAVPNAPPKPTTFLAGVGVIALEVAVDAASASAGTGAAGSALSWDPNWFKSSATLGLCLSDQGNRIAMLNHTPSLKGGFQVRLADAQTGRSAAVLKLPSGFQPFSVFSSRGAIWSLMFPGDRTPAQPSFSPDARRLAVAGSGVCVWDCAPSASIASNPIWLAQPAWYSSKPPPPPWYETQMRLQIHPTFIPHPFTSLSCSPHRRVCLELTTSVVNSAWGEVPLGFGMKRSYAPASPMNRTVWEALGEVWAASGQNVVCWDEELDLSSKLIQWRLDAKHSATKGFELEALIELEVTLTDTTGTALYKGCYRAAVQDLRVWEPSNKSIAKLQERALTACLEQMADDPNWERVLETPLRVAP